MSKAHLNCVSQIEINFSGFFDKNSNSKPLKFCFMKSEFSLDAEFEVQLSACLLSAAVGFLLTLIFELFKAII